MDTLKFLTELYGDASGWLTIWTLDRKTRWFHVPEQLTDIATFNPPMDVYFGVGLSANKKQSGRITAAEISAIPGLWMDVDLKTGKHAQDALPETVEDCLQLFPVPPSIVVHSGGGVHAYWLFREPWVFDTPAERDEGADLLKGFQATIQNAATLQGWKLDSTHDLSRILRMPGSTNYKSVPVPVTIISHNDDRYNADDLEQYAAEPIGKSDRTTGFQRNPQDGNADLLIDNCKFIQHCFANQKTLTEPEWLAMISNVARCADGENACHAMSAGYDNYSQRETDKKIQHALEMRPLSCRYIQSACQFTGCPKNGCSVKNPASWALSKEKRNPKPIPTGEYTIEVMTAEELENTDMPEPVWIVDGLLPMGFSLLCGKPKIGKSWMALDLGLTVALGGHAMGKIKTEQRKVLIMALEDPWRRLKSRLKLLSNGAKWPKELILIKQIPPADDGGLEELEKLIQAHQPELIVMDTFEIFRSKAKKNANAYSADYASAREIKNIADSYGISILAVHHLKKAAESDFVQSVSGSSGITGAADAIMVLDRMRFSENGDAVLKITGRDVEEAEWAVKKDQQTMGWLLLGPAEEQRKSEERGELARILRDNSDGMTPTDLARELDKKSGTVRAMLKRMASDMEVMKITGGRYILRENPF